LGDIVIASRNSGKIREILEIVGVRGTRFLGLSDISFEEEIPEEGNTFLDNALLKARRVHVVCSLPVISDDSGLCVDALGGRPGVHSARFSAPDPTDEKNIDLLLRMLRDVKDPNRSAHFACSAVFLYGTERYCHTEGRVDGFITGEPDGDGGFGYDPVFLVPEYGRTMARLTADEKNRISHRGRAFRALSPCIEAYLASS
jgi:XTP/dITP diphosphohydrolase